MTVDLHRGRAQAGRAIAGRGRRAGVGRDADSRLREAQANVVIK
jgi:hypothetical protein